MGRSYVPEPVREPGDGEQRGDENRMSRTWTIPNVAEYQYGKPPSIWWAVLAVLVIQVAGIVIAILDWDQSKPVISEPFFVRALLLPLLLSGAVCAVIYSSYENWILRVDWWNFLCRSERAAWRLWTQEHVAILGSVAVTPEPELAERLLGLEGSAPMNPGKILPLPETEAPAGVSRLGLILERLITPLTATLSGMARSGSVEIVLQSGDQQDMTVLRAVWQKLNLPGLVQFRWVPHAGTANHIETWFADAWPCDFRLLLGCQLHEEGMDPPWSEAAVALLLTSSDVLRRFEGKLRPQARLLRPIAMPSDSMVEAVETLLAAEQTPRGRIRHLWLTDLPREGRHATRGAVKEAGLELAVHDIDDAIGKPGPANGLLVQALAAQMVAHGQGAQLVASPDARSVRLNLVASQFAPVPRIEAGYMRVLSLSISGGLLFDPDLIRAECGRCIQRMDLGLPGRISLAASNPNRRFDLEPSPAGRRFLSAVVAFGSPDMRARDTWQGRNPPPRLAVSQEGQSVSATIAVRARERSQRAALPRSPPRVSLLRSFSLRHLPKNSRLRDSRNAAIVDGMSILTFTPLSLLAGAPLCALALARLPR